MGYQKSFKGGAKKQAGSEMFYSPWQVNTEETDVKGCQYAQKSPLRATGTSVKKGTGTQKGKRKGGEEHHAGAAKYCQPCCVHSMNKQKLVSGRSTDLYQDGFERVADYILCPQF